MIRIETDDAKAEELFGKLQLFVSDRSFDQPVEIAAWKCHRDLVVATPKKWTGMTRRAWQVKKPGEGARIISNTSKVMLFLEGGTGNAGTPTSNGGYIYPRTKRALFIPLNAKAAISGWDRSMVYGRDYVLAKRVRGIRARHIVKNYRPKAVEHLKNEMKTFLRNALQ